MSIKSKQVRHLIIPSLILLLILGGIFLLHQLHSPAKETSPYAFSTSSQPWSQAQDFVLETNPEGLIIKNTKIPFSSQLPLNWQAEVKKIEEQEWAVVIHSPQTKIDVNHLVQQGCWLNLETVQSGDLNQSIQQEILDLNKLADVSSSKPVFTSAQGEHKALTTGDNHPVLEKTSPLINQLQLITVYLPLEQGQIIKLEGQFSASDLQDCQQGLETILQTTKISQTQ